jgi:hypothetical protein
MAPNLLAMAPLSPRPGRNPAISQLVSQSYRLSSFRTPPPIAPLIIKPLTVEITNNDFFAITLQAEYAQAPLREHFPPAYPYVRHIIKSFKSETIQFHRSGRLGQLLFIKLSHEKAGTITLSEQECATNNSLQIVLAYNEYVKIDTL